MKKIRKIVIIFVCFVICIWAGNHVRAKAIGYPTKNENITNVENSMLPYDKIKDDDTVLKISGDVYIHGEVTIYDSLDKSKVVMTLNSDTDSRAKKARDIRNGVNIDTITVPTKSLRGYAPPTQLISLGVGASAAHPWRGQGLAKWEYSDYAYQPAPVTSATKPLYFASQNDSMRAGDSEDWTNTYNTGGNYGLLINNGSNLYVTGIGNILACWTWNANIGASYYVGNV